MIDAGADVNLTNKNGNRFPIELCVGCSHRDLVLDLLERGARYEIDTPPGVALQRTLYEITVNHPEKFKWYSKNDRENIKKVIQWLEEHGVRLDEFAPKLEE